VEWKTIHIGYPESRLMLTHAAIKQRSPYARFRYLSIDFFARAPFMRGTAKRRIIEDKKSSQ
jgi:hypothetical protein